MSQKIFISYRRQDSAANVLGIAQYLEHEFGRKNVFVDVDMRAGANFPSVLEQRLAECKVMLVLIGPDWINARDENGQRRLDDPDDWVRLEIAHALKRKISVIPVRIDGSALPSKGMLPDEIRGLLNHQAASVTLAGFRHEMSGLVRDIRSIPSARSWRRYAALAAGLLLVGGAVVLAPASLERFRSLVPTQPSEMTEQNGIWKSNPGEWVMYAVDQNPAAYFFKPSSVKVFGDDAAYTARYPLKSSVGTSSEQASTQGVYEDNLTVVDCKKSTTLLAEWTIYNKSGESIAHFKRGDPQALDMSAGDPIQPGSILSIGQKIICDKQMSTPLLSEQQLIGLNSADQLAETKLSYLTVAHDGNGDIFYGPTKQTSNSDFPVEALFVLRFRANQDFAQFFQGQAVIGLPPKFRTLVQEIQFNCGAKKVQTPRMEYYSPENYLVYLIVADPLAPIAVGDNSPFGMMLNVACGGTGSKVSGTYQGTNTATYKRGGQGEQEISLTVAQSGDDVKISFQTANGGQGTGTGKLTGSKVAPLSLQSTAPDCPGSYQGSIGFSGDIASWSYQGQDCG
jgi:hypothetical protein